MSSGNLLLAGIALLFIGVVLVFAYFFSQPSAGRQSGGAVFIGPFPIIFGSFNNPQTIGLLKAIGIVIGLFIILQLLFRKW